MTTGEMMKPYSLNPSFPDAPGVHRHDGLSACPECEKYRAQSMLSPSLPFSVAVEIWLNTHKNYVHPNTHHCYRQYARRLAEFFQQELIGTMHIGHVRSYQAWRSERAGATRTNGEVHCVLKPILREIERWDFIAQVYRPLPIPKKKVRKSMSEDEERRLLAVALDSSKPKRLVAGHCLIVMANTTMGFGELRHLKREDVFLSEAKPFVTVNEGTKNDFRRRTIPLNWLALRSMRWLLRRWEKLGGAEPGQYLLPHHAQRSTEERAGRGHQRKSPPDFTQPMGHIYRAARGILREAGLTGMVPYDMRSHASTKILSDPNVSDQMAEELMGHASKEMRKRYSAQRLEKKAVIMDRMCLEQEPKVRLLLFPGGRK